MILVVGDLILDEYVFGRCERVSQEAPVPVMIEERRETRLGGAANVARNVMALGSDAHLVSVCGRDMPTCTYDWRIVVDESRPTTKKTRYLVGGQQIMRSDHETTLDLDSRVENIVLLKLDKALKELEPTCVVVSDYGKGTVTARIWDKIATYCRHHTRTPLIADPCKRPFSFYEGADLLTPNRYEYADNVERFRLTEPDRYFCPIVVTLGERGMMILENGERNFVKGVKRDVVDVTGAGDTVIAALAVHVENYGADVPWLSACRFANAAASVAVTKLGTSLVMMSEIPEY